MDVNNCSLFGFMSETLGINVLHPGGYKATDALIQMCPLDSNSTLLDLGCGSGSSSFFLAKKYGCRVVGIDLSKGLIDKARIQQDKQENPELLHFQAGDAMKLPFEDNSFDRVIGQAFFILIDDKQKVLEEVFRVLKPGGCFCSLELNWFRKPALLEYQELVEKTCESMVPRMMLFEEWTTLNTSLGFRSTSMRKNPMPGGVLKLLKTEGISNFMKIMGKMLGNPDHRKKMMTVQETFKKYSHLMGYGLFSFQK